MTLAPMRCVLRLQLPLAHRLRNTICGSMVRSTFEENPRVMRCLKAIQRLALAKTESLKFPLEWKLHIVSRNNFPTAAGLASSAAGYACLVYTLASLYGIADEELTSIARQGSGSACRSLHGGFVRWHMGKLDDGSDSIATPVATASHWPNMHVLILVANDGRKRPALQKACSEP
ncbi:Diphosphomevalonate decarboxylase [Eumeta japonica]|uniref:Diphosphomevalonate decarboxylase n=1 Tax=Eumeta variegata TaxID=151549 RepID=A0A4C1T8H0_EUMVA|nr:Diphosphomevalonate decarboxylase [Eumeta japonica]